MKRSCVLAVTLLRSSAGPLYPARNETKQMNRQRRHTTRASTNTTTGTRKRLVHRIDQAALVATIEKPRLSWQRFPPAIAHHVPSPGWVREPELIWPLNRNSHREYSNASLHAWKRKRSTGARACYAHVEAAWAFGIMQSVHSSAQLRKPRLTGKRID